MDGCKVVQKKPKTFCLNARAGEEAEMEIQPETEHGVMTFTAI